MEKGSLEKVMLSIQAIILAVAVVNFWDWFLHHILVLIPVVGILAAASISLVNQVLAKASSVRPLQRWQARPYNRLSQAKNIWGNVLQNTVFIGLRADIYFVDIELIAWGRILARTSRGRERQWIFQALHAHSEAEQMRYLKKAGLLQWMYRATDYVDPSSLQRMLEGMAYGLQEDLLQVSRAHVACYVPIRHPHQWPSFRHQTLIQKYIAKGVVDVVTAHVHQQCTFSGTLDTEKRIIAHIAAALQHLPANYGYIAAIDALPEEVNTLALQLWEKGGEEERTLIQGIANLSQQLTIGWTTWLSYINYNLLRPAAKEER